MLDLCGKNVFLHWPVKCDCWLLDPQNRWSKQPEWMALTGNDAACEQQRASPRKMKQWWGSDKGRAKRKLSRMVQAKSPSCVAGSREQGLPQLPPFSCRRGELSGRGCSAPGRSWGQLSPSLLWACSALRWREPSVRHITDAVSDLAASYSLGIWMRACLLCVCCPWARSGGTSYFVCKLEILLNEHSQNWNRELWIAIG